MSKRKLLGALVSLLLASCGGGAASGAGADAPKGNDDEAASTSETPTGESEAAEPEAKAKEPGAAKEAETNEAATTTLEGDDLKSVLQLVLGDPELIDNLQLKKPGRQPLKVSGAGLPDKLAVAVGSHDVKVVPEPKSPKDPVLLITKLERTGDQAKVHYRFEVEGLEGRASCVLKNGRWELSANRVVKK